MNKPIQSLRISLLVVIAAIDSQVVTSANPVDDLEPGHWLEVPNSNIRKVSPNPVPKGNFTAGTEAWSGGAYDTKRDRLIIWGGGHKDYSGNEIYVFDVNALTWTRLTNPSYDVGGIVESGLYPDGKPRSRHTYNYIEYIPTIDRFCSFGAAGLYPSGVTSTDRTDCFNFNSLEWELRTRIPSSNGRNESVSSYDPVTGFVYHKPNFSSKMAVYDPMKNIWTMKGRIFFKGSKLTSAIDPKRQIMLFVGAGKFLSWDLKTGLDTSLTESMKGNAPSKRSPGLVYDPDSDRFIVWQGGASVYVFNMDNLTWTKRAPAATNNVTPPDQSTWGTFGRFRYIPSKNAYIVVSSVDQNVFFYKLSTEGLDDSPPAPPTDARAD